MTTVKQHQKVHEFLQQHPMGILSTVSSLGQPWGSAIYYVTDEDFNFYFVTRAGTTKYHNLKETSLAALTIVDTASQTTVQLAGRIAPLPIHEYMDVIFDKLAKLKPTEDHNWAPPVNKIHEGNFMPMKLTPNTMHYANFSQAQTSHDKDVIEVIIPASQ